MEPGAWRVAVENYPLPIAPRFFEVFALPVEQEVRIAATANLGVINGIVREPGGTPLTDMEVRVLGSTIEPSLTDGSGRFQLDCPVGRQVMLRAKDPQNGWFKDTIAGPYFAPSMNVEIVMHPSVVLRLLADAVINEVQIVPLIGYVPDAAKAPQSIRVPANSVECAGLYAGANLIRVGWLDPELPMSTPWIVHVHDRDAVVEQQVWAPKTLKVSTIVAGGNGARLEDAIVEFAIWLGPMGALSAEDLHAGRVGDTERRMGALMVDSHCFWVSLFSAGTDMNGAVGTTVPWGDDSDRIFLRASKEGYSTEIVAADDWGPITSRSGRSEVNVYVQLRPR
jgi:hypothetical protein